ncbi:hypothetical protein PENSPDRAFT_671425 [Peniophora sp. CONT]|nr:hypothetical protein PENSPDRAFT_671425 [Peniophora sp. CONT]
MQSYRARLRTRQADVEEASARCYAVQEIRKRQRNATGLRKPYVYGYAKRAPRLSSIQFTPQTPGIMEFLGLTLHIVACSENGDGYLVAQEVHHDHPLLHRYRRIDVFRTPYWTSSSSYAHSHIRLYYCIHRVAPEHTSSPATSGRMSYLDAQATFTARAARGRARPGLIKSQDAGIGGGEEADFEYTERSEHQIRG